MKKSEIKLSKSYAIFNMFLIFMYAFIMVSMVLIQENNISSNYIAYCSICVSLIAILISIKIQVNNEKSIEINRKAERKVEIIPSVKSDEIKGKIEELYKNSLIGKSIDKIEIVNTSIGQSDNRKDVIIIYH